MTVLGPVRVADRDPGGPLARALVAALALGAGDAPRTTGALAEDLWGDEPPRHPRAALQSLVSRLRAAAGDPGIVVTEGGGYALAEPAEGCRSDLDRAGALAEAAGRERLPERRLEMLDSALALWTGDPGEDLGAAPVAADLAERAAELRDRLRRLRARARSELGLFGEAAAELRGVAEARPFDEAVHLELMTALARAGERAEALSVFAAFRERLRDELGVSPGASIAAANAELLREQEAGARARVRIGVRIEPGELIGRERDLERVGALIRARRLVTILGPGGIGKTRLAHALAAASEAPAVAVVPLASVRADGDVAAAIATAIGVSEATASARLSEARLRPELRDLVLAALDERPTLLVLDNCEQVIDGVAAWVAEALARVPGLSVLATSRTPLALAAEQVFPLGPLAVAEATGGAGLAAPPPAPDGPAVRLFVERAQAVRPGAALDRGTVARLCERLDGLPLAIELAAARVRTMTPEQIEARLEDRFALLTSGDRAAPERHRTLQAVIEWSWDLLDDEARAALEALSLLPGGFSAETAAGVLAADGTGARPDADDLLDRLVAQSLLVVFDAPASGGVRFRMLETVREFGIARLRREDREDSAWAAVRAWGRSFVLRRAPRAFGLPGSLGAEEFRVIRAEQGNLLAALRSAIAAGEHGTAVLVFGALAQSLLIRGAHTELNGIGKEAFRSLLAVSPDEVPGSVPADALALALLLCSVGFMTEEDPGAARALVKLKLLVRSPAGSGLRPLWRNSAELLSGIADPERIPGEVARLASSPDSETRLLVALLGGMLAENDGRTGEAKEAAQLAWQLSQRLDEPWIGVMAASSAAQLANQTAHPAEALVWLDRAMEDLEAFDAQDELRERSWLRGTALLGLGRNAEARAVFEGLTRTPGSAQDGREHSSIGWVGLAEAARAEGDREAAIGGFRRALSEFEHLDQRASPWYLMTLSAYVAGAAIDGSLGADELTGLAARLRARALAIQRVQPRFIDRPVLGTVLIGWAGWAVTVPRLVDRAVQGLAFAEALGARQDLPSLNLAAHLARAADLAGASAVEAAREAAGSLADDELAPRALEALAAPLR